MILKRKRHTVLDFDILTLKTILKINILKGHLKFFFLKLHPWPYLKIMYSTLIIGRWWYLMLYFMPSFVSLCLKPFHRSPHKYLIFEDFIPGSPLL